MNQVSWIDKPALDNSTLLKKSDNRPKGSFAEVLNVKKSAEKPKEAQTPVKVEKKDVEKSETQKRQAKTETEATTKVKSAKPEAVDKTEKLTPEALEALKEKLLKKTGLSEEQLMYLLDALQIDLQSPESLKLLTEDPVLMAALENFVSASIDFSLEQVGTDEAVEESVDTVFKAFVDVYADVSKAPPETKASTPVDAEVFVEMMQEVLKEVKVKPDEVTRAVPEKASVSTEPLQSMVKEDGVKVDAKTILEAPKLVNSGGEKMQAKGEQTTKVTVDENAAAAKSDVATTFQQLLTKQPVGVIAGKEAVAMPKDPVVQQVVEWMKGPIRISEAGTTMKMTLKPDTLGEVELKLNLHKGTVLAEIKVENEMVKAAIEANLDQLKHNLSNKGYQVGQMSVSVDLTNKEQAESHTHGESGRQSQQKPFDLEEIVEEGVVMTQASESGLGSHIDFAG
ncbi:flagellar hook-length control protein FliK [Fusibacter sp. JL298sf-3]